MEYADVQRAVDYLSSKTTCRPELAIICGSGLGSLVEMLKDKEPFSYEDIPHFAVGSVAGHAGRLVFGQFNGKDVVCMDGRVHAYEGYGIDKITLPVRVMSRMGARILLCTNSCGALNPEFNVGDIMLIKDHINLPGLMGINPLVGQRDERFGRRFVALSNAYNQNYLDVAHTVARDLEMTGVKEGVYAFQVGPCYETVTESRMMRLLGADVAGMSSVPEVIVARQLNMDVIAISLVTNMCVTEFACSKTANHEDVLEAGRNCGDELRRFVTRIIETLLTQFV